MTLPDHVAELMRARSAGTVWLTQLEPGQADRFDAVAEHAGIEPLGKAWKEADRESALRLVTAVLHRDLAYSVELMTEHRASWLAEQFIESVGKYDSRFATNCESVPGEHSWSWTSATDFTFDAGVVAIGPEGSALYWVADED